MYVYAHIRDVYACTYTRIRTRDVHAMHTCIRAYTYSPHLLGPRPPASPPSNTSLTISDGDQEGEEEDLWLSITRPRELRCLPVPSPDRRGWPGTVVRQDAVGANPCSLPPTHRAHMHTTACPHGAKGWGCRSLLCRMGPAAKLEVRRIFPTETVPRRSPPHPPTPRLYGIPLFPPVLHRLVLLWVVQSLGIREMLGIDAASHCTAAPVSTALAYTYTATGRVFVVLCLLSGLLMKHRNGNKWATISVEHILCEIFVRNLCGVLKDLQGYMPGCAFAHKDRSRQFG